MLKFKILDKGWDAGELEYGLGLMFNDFPPQSMFVNQPPDTRYSRYIGHVGMDWGSIGYGGYHPAMNFAISATSNDFSFCWDRKLQQYAWGCGVQDLLCGAWNIVFDELGGHGNKSHGLLNCSQFDHLHPLP